MTRFSNNLHRQAPHFIEGPMPSEDSERSMNMYVRGIDVVSFCDSDI